MNVLLEGFLKMAAIPAGGVIAKVYLWNPLMEWLAKKKMAKLYEAAGTTKEAPPAPAFAPISKPADDEIQRELERVKIRHVLQGTDLAEAQQATHRMREIIDQLRNDLNSKNAELVVLRQRVDELTGKVAEGDRKYAELTSQSLKLREEYDRKLKEGGTDEPAVTDDGRHSTDRIDRPVGHRRGPTGLPPPPRIQRRGKGPEH